MDDDVTRILNCVNSYWPAISFTHNDIRRPPGEKFRELLRQFFKSFIIDNFQLPNVSLPLTFLTIFSRLQLFFLLFVGCNCTSTLATHKCILTWNDARRVQSLSAWNSSALSWRRPVPIYSSK